VGLASTVLRSAVLSVEISMSLDYASATNSMNIKRGACGA